MRIKRQRVPGDEGFEGDTSYTWGMAWGASYVGLSVFFLFAGIMLASPAALLGALFFGSWGVWRLRNYSQARKADLEHQRTSPRRIAVATAGLEKGGWRRHVAATTNVKSRSSSSDDSGADHAR